MRFCFYSRPGVLSLQSNMDFSADIEAAVNALKDGGVILYPTDTVWGIGCDATRSDAVKKVFEIKRRAQSKAMITLVGDLNMLERYVEQVPEPGLQLLELAVTPITLILNGVYGLAPELLAEDGSAGFRVTEERYSRELCRRLRHPIVSTSANISGEQTPLCFAEISPEIRRQVDYMASYRRDDNEPKTPSSVIKLTPSGVITIIRK